MRFETTESGGETACRLQVGSRRIWYRKTDDGSLASVRQRVDGLLEGVYFGEGDKCEYGGDLMQGYACISTSRGGRLYRYQGGVKDGRFEGLGELEVQCLGDQEEEVEEQEEDETVE